MAAKKFPKFLAIGLVALSATSALIYSNADKIDEFTADKYNVSVFEPSVADVRIKQIANEFKGVNKATRIITDETQPYSDYQRATEFVNETVTSEMKEKLNNKDFYYQFIQKINTPFEVYSNLSMEEKHPASFTNEPAPKGQPLTVDERIANYNSNVFDDRMDKRDVEIAQSMEAVKQNINTMRDTNIKQASFKFKNFS